MDLFTEYMAIARFPGAERDLALQRHLKQRYSRTSPQVKGKAAAEIGIVPPPPQHSVFDARRLQRWKNQRSLLPQESQIWYDRKSPWQVYPRAMTAATIALLFQSALITALLLNHLRRKRIEAELTRSEDRYRQVVESQTEMVCRYKPDSTLTFVNEAYCRYFGKSRDELVGTPFYSLIPEEMHEQVKQSIDRLVDEKLHISHEHQVIRPDGLITWMQWEDYPIFDAAGNLLELQGIGRDITKRREALESLRQSEERFSGIFRGSPVAISIIRQADGRLLEVNPSWENVFEIQRSDALNFTPLQLGLTDDPEYDRKLVMFLNSGKTLRGFEHKILTKSGKTRWMSISCEPILLNGEPSYIMMSHDITSQMEVEAAKHSLVHATKLAMLGELTASIAHEVNQPLGAILSNADTAEILLKNNDPPIAEIKNIISDIRRDDLRASEIIKRVRGMVAERDMQMTSLDLNEILRDVEALIAHDVQRHGVKILRELGADLPSISGDRVQIEQIMLNLLLNAIDALHGMPVAQRWIVIRSSRHEENWVEACVEDSGPGITAHTLPRIFDSFFTTKSTGMGIGLALSRSIAEAHCGRLTACNNPHGGATLRLVLPIPFPS